MANTWIRKREGKFRAQTQVILGVLAVAIIAGLGAAPYKAFGQTSNSPPSGRISFFDPFSLNTISLDVPGGSNAVVPAAVGTGPSASGASRTPDPVIANAPMNWRRPPIRIPYRPPVASPSRPPWVPGPPPWWPGPPPWAPGPQR
jgi:hypothetical protein